MIITILLHEIVHKKWTAIPLLSAANAIQLFWNSLIFQARCQTRINEHARALLHTCSTYRQQLQTQTLQPQPFYFNKIHIISLEQHTRPLSTCNGTSECFAHTFATHTFGVCIYVLVHFTPVKSNLLLLLNPSNST